METKKITIISSYFAPAWAYGGPPKVLFTLAKALIRSGNSVSVITTDSLGEKRSNKLEEETDKIKIYRLKNLSNILAYKAKFFYAPKISAKVDEILERSDIVLFSDTRSVFNWQFYRKLKDKNIPYGVFSFGQIPHGSGVKSVIKKLFDWLWVKNFMGNAFLRFAQTEHERQMYDKYFGIPEDKVKLLPLPVEDTVGQPTESEMENFRKKWKIGINDKVITFTGRIHYLKGIDILVKSLESLLRDDKQIKLLIVGRDDGYLSSLLSLTPQDLKGKIIFTGPLYNGELRQAFAVSSCFAITPRFFEETSTASLEALSWGIPVVVTKEAQIPYFSNYSAGFVVENNLSAIQTAINKILNATAAEKLKMSAQAKKIISDHFAAGKVAEELISWFK